MKLEGIHHVTCITADAPRNLDFYTRALGLRLVKKSVNQDDPTVYHLFYADDLGSPGADITFFEYPGALPGRAGAGMVHRVVWRVGTPTALDFWQRRLESERVPIERRGDECLLFEDPEGLGLELAVVRTTDTPLVASSREVPVELALRGFHGVRAYAAEPAASRRLLEQGLAFAPTGEATWEARGAVRGSFYAYDPPPAERPRGGAGTVHHVAWASPMNDHEAWHERVADHGANPTDVIDRFWFRSIYFREPSGVLFEIATMGPGFAVDEEPEHLGERLVLPPAYEPLRERIEPLLTPLPVPPPPPGPPGRFHERRSGDRRHA